MDDLLSVDPWEAFLDWSIDDTLKHFPGDVSGNNEDVKGHIPGMVSHLKSDLTSTATIPNHLVIEGAHTLYLVLFPKLDAITKLVGDDFLQAWWATAKSHLALWQNGVYHGEISSSNLMYYEMHGKIMGILNDFDLASTEDGPTGTERTGTIPFMAVTLLQEKGIQGKIKHSYHHDAESFIWVLTWITSRYDNGALRSTDRPLDQWLTTDASTCREKKNDFLLGGNYLELQAGGGHEQNWQVAKRCLRALRRHIIDILDLEDPNYIPPVDHVFQTLLHAPVTPSLSSGATSS